MDNQSIIEHNLKNFVFNRLQLSALSSQKVNHWVSSRVISRLIDPKVGKDLILMSFDPDFSSPKYQKILIIGNGPWISIQQRKYQSVGYWEKQSIFIRNSLRLKTSLRKPSNKIVVRQLDYQHYVRFPIDIFMEINLVKRVKSVDQRSWMNSFLEMILNLFCQKCFVVRIFSKEEIVEERLASFEDKIVFNTLLWHS